MILIAGPCQVESFDHCMKMAGIIAAVAARLGAPIIFKASFDKANRTSGSTPRGVGLAEALRVFAAIGEEHGLEVTTDVHERAQVQALRSVVGMLQIPALLCRQTDLIEAAAKSGRAVNIKKGQGVAPDDMAHAVDKAKRAKAGRVFVTERGTSFGHHDLVVDFRGVNALKRSGADAVIFDASHSSQLPSALGGSSGGSRETMPVLARAAIAAGFDGIFVETHDHPDKALSDGPISWPADKLYDFLAPLIELHEYVSLQ